MTQTGPLLHLALIAALALACGCTKKAQPIQSSGTLAPEPTNQALKPPPPEAIDWSQFHSTSVRNPSDGALRGGVPLPLTAPGLRFSPKKDPKTRFGTVEVVRSLVEAGSRVEEALGGLPIMINELSYAEGGPIPHHRSHQSGRDVDVLFYQIGPNGEPIESVGAFFDPSGKGVDFRDLSDPSDDVTLYLDIPRNWLFLRSLIEDEDAHLQQIFVAEHLRALLLDYARREGQPATTVQRFAEMSCQPSYPHDDHFHFRFFCAPDDIVDGCLDSPPMYPWHLEKLEAAGIRPRPLAPNRDEARARIVTHEEAREAAGPMDAEVERWLERRKQWLAQPHPGRAYCP